MFRCWSDLKEWLRTSADMLRWRRDVRRDRANDPKWTGLRPAQLAVARDWPKRRRDELTAEEVDWISRGILWERTRRSMAATVLLVVALLAGIAWWQRNEAVSRKQEAQVAETEKEKQRQEAVAAARIANVRRLAAESSSALREYSQRSLLLAVEAVREEQSLREVRVAVAEQSLREMLASVGGRAIARAGGPITTLAISPDNRWVVTASSDDKTARLWDLRTKDPVTNPVILRGHESVVSAVAISPDSRWVVTGSWDRTARLWDLSAKDPAANPVILRGHEREVIAVAISPDNRWVVSGSDDTTVRLWDLRTKDPATNPVILRGHERAVSAVAISPDNRWVVTGSWDGTALR
jgi:protease II